MFTTGLLQTLTLLCGRLTDLRHLITNGVADCNVLLILGTKGFFTRPWCLLEIVHGARLNVPIIIIDIKNGSFDAEESQHFVDDLEVTMGANDPSGLELLHEHLGPDLTELKAACTAVLRAFTENGKKKLSWNPNATDTELIACLKDIVDEMGAATGNKLEWKSNAHSGHARKQHKPSAAQSARPALRLICNVHEALNEARVLQTELAMRLDRLVSTSVPNFTGAPDMMAHTTEAVAVLLTRHVLHEPAALVEVFAAIQDAKPIVPVCLMGHGYDFKDAQAHLSELETRLGPRKLAELREGLCALSSGTPDAKAVSIGELQAALLATLPRIIAVNWEPQGGKHQLDSTVTNVLARLKTRPHGTALKRKVLQVTPALRQSTEAPAAVAPSTTPPAQAAYPVPLANAAAALPASLPFKPPPRFEPFPCASVPETNRGPTGAALLGFGARVAPLAPLPPLARPARSECDS